MVIRPGEPWGETGTPPPSAPTVRNEAALGDLWERGGREAVLQSGTLRSVTGSAEGPNRVCAPVDVVIVEWTGPDGPIRRPLFGSMAVCSAPLGVRLDAIVTNSGFWRGRRAVPAAHPNDGILDVLELSRDMAVAQRWLAWRRSARLDHLPHPGLTVHRGRDWTWSGGPCTVWIDGRRGGRAHRLTCSVIPDAMRIWL